MKKKYPFIKQQHPNNCGPACLAMIVRYYGGTISQEALGGKMHTDQNGTTAYHLLETARQIGFQAEGWRIAFEEVGQLSLPAIAHIIIQSFHHYIVIYENDFSKRQFLIADPNDQLKWISYDELESVSDHIFLTLIPTHPFLKAPNRYKNWFVTIFKVLCPFIPTTLLYTIMTLFLSIGFACMLPIFLQTPFSLIGIFVFFLLVLLFKNIFTYFKHRVFLFLQEALDKKLCKDAYDHLLSLPYPYYRKRTTGEIVSYLQDLEKVQDVFLTGITLLFLDVPILILLSIALFQIHVWFFCLGFGLFLLLTIFYFVFLPLFPRFWNMQEGKARNLSVMVESFQGFESIRGSGLREAMKLRFINSHRLKEESHHTFYLSLGRRTCFYQTVIDSIQLLFIGGGCLLLPHTISIESLLLGQAFFSLFLNSFQNIVSFFLDFGQGKEALDRFLELPEVPKEEGILDDMVDTTIEICHLHYGYPKGKKVFEDANWVFAQGRKYMLVGASGSGKSTLLQLLKQYYPLGEGMIYIGGHRLSHYRESALSEMIYLSQEEILFTDTLYYNLTMGEDVDRKEIETVCEICKLTDIFERNKAGLSLVIEENGFNLSKGEKERIILARALLRPFKILLLDESLGQVEETLERQILEGVFKQYPERTILFVSHRTSNTDLFDEVIEINDKKICRKE